MYKRQLITPFDESPVVCHDNAAPPLFRESIFPCASSIKAVAISDVGSWLVIRNEAAISAVVLTIM